MNPFCCDSSIVSNFVPSPNFGERRNGRLPDMILLHYTGMENADEALTRLCDPDSEVSAHYVVLEDGDIIQCVREAMRAWHAGLSSWAGEEDINSCSVGIEIVNRGHDWGCPDYPQRQIAALITLCRGICLRLNVPPQRVLGHSDVSPERKRDPGEKFPWHLLANSGVGHWTTPVPIQPGHSLILGAHSEEVLSFQQALLNYGYKIELTGRYDAQTLQVVTAFQRHFRPARVDGIADLSTLQTLRLLQASLPRLPGAGRGDNV